MLLVRPKTCPRPSAGRRMNGPSHAWAWQPGANSLHESRYHPHVMRFLFAFLVLLTSTALAAPPATAPSTEPSAKRFGQPPGVVAPPPPFPNGHFELLPNETIVF